MGRRYWATDEQLDFLEGRHRGMEKERQDQTLTVLYARAAADFIQRWPSPPPKDEDLRDLTPAQIKALSDEKRTKVCFFVLVSSICRTE